MYTDNIIKEVWENRESYVSEHHHNMNEIMNDLMMRQKNTNRTVVNRYNLPNNKIQLTVGSADRP
jgi:hypothetical protein